MLLVAAVFRSSTIVGTTRERVADQLALALAGLGGLATRPLFLGVSTPSGRLGSVAGATSLAPSLVASAGLGGLGTTSFSLAATSLGRRGIFGLGLLVAERASLARVWTNFALHNKSARCVAFSVPIFHDVVWAPEGLGYFAWDCFGVAASAAAPTTAAAATPLAQEAGSLIQRRLMLVNVMLFFFAQHELFNLVQKPLVCTHALSWEIG